MNRREEKNFKDWMVLKEKTHLERKIRTYKEGEIWWCKIGENVGNEICGKGRDFLRPVLVIRKLSRSNFIGVPLTSRKHSGTWYTNFVFKNKLETAVVAQVENISVYRMHYKMGEVPQSDLEEVVSRLCNLLLKTSE